MRLRLQNALVGYPPRPQFFVFLVDRRQEHASFARLEEFCFFQRVIARLGLTRRPLNKESEKSEESEGSAAPRRRTRSWA